MTMLDVGTYGAKVQSWSAANPRDLLKSIIDQNPGTDEKALLSLLRGRLQSDDGEDYLASIIEYWFVNNYRSLVHPPRRTAPAGVSRAARQKSVAAIKEKVKARIRHEAQMILLDITMPNGKALRECTGKDCAKAGGWFTKIAAKMKPSQIVGEVLDEGAVRKLYGC